MKCVKIEIMLVTWSSNKTENVREPFVNKSSFDLKELIITFEVNVIMRVKDKMVT